MKIAAPELTSADVSRQVPERWSLYLPAVLIVALVAWPHFLPVFPGYALAAAVAAAAILLVRANVAPLPERIVWVVLTVCLVSVELHTALRQHRQAGDFLICRVAPDGRLAVQAHGPDPIRSAKMFVIDLDGVSALEAARAGDELLYEARIRRVSAGDFENGTEKFFGVRPVEPDGGTAHYRIVFTADNGSWWEDLQVRAGEGSPLEALRIVRFHEFKPEVLLQWTGAGFLAPAEAAPDWTWAAKTP